MNNRLQLGTKEILNDDEACPSMEEKITTGGVFLRRSSFRRDYSLPRSKLVRVIQWSLRLEFPFVTLQSDRLDLPVQRIKLAFVKFEFGRARARRTLFSTRSLKASAS